jgi:hypothetical protein
MSANSSPRHCLLTFASISGLYELSFWPIRYFGTLPLFSALAASKSGFLTHKWLYKNFLKKTQKMLDLLSAIWFNAIISLGAEEKTHSDSNTFIAL